MAIDEGTCMWMKGVENSRASFFSTVALLNSKTGMEQQLLLVLTVAYTVTGCNTKFSYLHCTIHCIGDVMGWL